MVFINFKTYKPGTGNQAEKLAKICQTVSKKEKVKIILLPQTADIFRLCQTVSLPVWSQHLDAIEFGPHTGQVLPEAVFSAGASGTILNHSENKIPPQLISESIKRVRNLKAKVLVCCDSIEEAEEIAEFKPDFLAYEPPEFIGHREISVASAKPEVIADFVKKFSKLPIIIGAGIHSQHDVRAGLNLGAKGILVATDIVLAQDPKKELTELAKGFKK